MPGIIIVTFTLCIRNRAYVPKLGCVRVLGLLRTLTMIGKGFLFLGMHSYVGTLCVWLCNWLKSGHWTSLVLMKLVGLRLLVLSAA